MARIGHGDKRYARMASSIGVLAAEQHGKWVRLWWHTWRWPAGLLAGVVLWLTLVAIAGATPPHDAVGIAALQATVAAHNS
jgi:hypothetical protein